jgi:hypothetical protein
MYGFTGVMDTQKGKIVENAHFVAMIYACQQSKGFKNVAITGKTVIGFSITSHRGG